jgi:hypothetical protein
VIFGIAVGILILFYIIYSIINRYLKKRRWKPTLPKLSTIRNKNWSSLKFTCLKNSVDFKKHEFYISNITEMYLKNKEIFQNDLLKKREKIWNSKMNTMSYSKYPREYINELKSSGWKDKIIDMSDSIVISYIKEVYKDIFNLNEESLKIKIIEKDWQDEILDKLLESKFLGIQKQSNSIYSRNKAGFIQYLWIKYYWCIEIESKIHGKVRIYSVDINTIATKDVESITYFKGLIYSGHTYMHLKGDVQISNLKWAIKPLGLLDLINDVAIPEEFKDEETEKLQAYGEKGNETDVLKVMQPSFLYSIIQESKIHENKYSIYFSPKTSSNFIAVSDFPFPDNDPESNENNGYEGFESTFTFHPWTMFQDDYSANYWTLKINPSMARMFRLMKYLYGLKI